MAVQLKEVAKLKSGSAQPNRNKVAEITWEQVKTIAEDKMPDLNCFTVESAMRMVAGTARSVGITVKGLSLNQFNKLQENGKTDKNQKLALSKIEAGKTYTLQEAAEKVKEITFTKFDASLDIDVRLGVDPRKANRMVRGVVSLPHGTGKQVRSRACNADAEAAAKEAGADYVGLDEYIDKIKGGWTDVDVIITQPSVTGQARSFGPHTRPARPDAKPQERHCYDGRCKGCKGG